MNRRFGALSSSINPQELSLTVTAGARMLIALLTTLGYLGMVQADTILEQMPAIFLAGYTTWQGIETIWGAVRKIIVKFTEE